MWLVLLLDFLIINLLCLQIFMHFLIYKCISYCCKLFGYLCNPVVSGGWSPIV